MHSSDNAATTLDGILLVDKPEGPTSMRVIERVRRAAGGVRCGHAGTLDPLATGLLVVALGRFTKEIDRLMGGDKKYETVIDLSAFTATDDREGERIAVAIDQPPTAVEIEAALKAFRGSIMQTPPAFSAVKIGGRRSYDIARRAMKAAPSAGTTDAAPEPTRSAPRPALVHELTLRSYEWPLVTLDIHCAKGFYVRSLARELGLARHTGGYCHAIRRTWSAPFSVDHACALDSLPDAITAAHLLRIP